MNRFDSQYFDVGNLVEMDADRRTRDGLDDANYWESIGSVWKKSSTYIAYDIVHYSPWYVYDMNIDFTAFIPNVCVCCVALMGHLSCLCFHL